MARFVTGVTELPTARRAVKLRMYGISSHAAVATALLLQAVQILPMTALALVLAPDLLFRRARAEAP